jgi:hypothetical protein
MSYAVNKYPTVSFSRAEAQPAPKPVLNGIWQFAGNDGNLHEILHWVDTDEPTGPVPSNPGRDPQYRFWELPVQNWAQANGFTNLPRP